jgi:hypothetical protein
MKLQKLLLVRFLQPVALISEGGRWAAHAKTKPKSQDSS